jgi:hypothetical protein
MVHQRFYGQSESFVGLRCVACGEIIDETILENRQKNGRTMDQKNKKKITAVDKTEYGQEKL